MFEEVGHASKEASQKTFYHVREEEGSEACFYHEVLRLGHAAVEECDVVRQVKLRRRPKSSEDQDKAIRMRKNIARRQ